MTSRRLRLHLFRARSVPPPRGRCALERRESSLPCRDHPLVTRYRVPGAPAAVPTSGVDSGCPGTREPGTPHPYPPESPVPLSAGHALSARSSTRTGGCRRCRPFLQCMHPECMHPARELSPLVVRHDLLESGEHLILLLGCMMLDVLLELAHALLEAVDVIVQLAQARHLLLHPRMLLQRLVDLLEQLAVGEGPDRRVEDLLLDEGMYLELRAYLLRDLPAFHPGDLAHGSAEQAGDAAAALERFEQLADLLVVVGQHLDRVHLIPPAASRRPAKPTRGSQFGMSKAHACNRPG